MFKADLYHLFGGAKRPISRGMTPLEAKDNIPSLNLDAMQRVYQFFKKNVSALFSQGELVRYAKGQILFYEGHQPFGFFLLKKGEVSFSSGQGLSHYTLLECKETPALGLMDLLGEHPYCSTCTSCSDVDAIFFSKAAVFDFLKVLTQASSMNPCSPKF